MADDKKGLYRAMRQLRNGGLHRALRLPEGQDIPADRLEKAKTSKNPHVVKMTGFHQPK